MSVSKADIQQIRKYLNGELDARAMYELELRAQNDAELMDVMQGMETAGGDHQPHIDQINLLIQQRVAKPERRVVPMFRYWAAAASVLLMLGIGGWWLSRQTPGDLQPVELAKNAPLDKVKVDTSALVKIPVPVNNTSQIASADKPVIRRRRAKPTIATIIPLDSLLVDSSKNLIAANRPNSLEEVVVRGYVTQKREQTTGASYIVTGKEVQDHPVANVEQVLQGKVAGLNIQNAPDDKASKAFGHSGNKATKQYEQSTGSTLAYRTVYGTIKDALTGEPLTGATISIPGRGLAQADVNGKFALTLPENVSLLNASFIGYKPYDIALKKDNYLDIALVPENRALSETVIRGYTKRPLAADIITDTAACKEDLKFKAKFFDNIAIIQKLTEERIGGLKLSVSDRQATKALTFLARYAPVSIRTKVKNGITYADMQLFNAEKDVWIKWYESNKCKGLKYPKLPPPK